MHAPTAYCCSRKLSICSELNGKKTINLLSENFIECDGQVVIQLNHLMALIKVYYFYKCMRIFVAHQTKKRAKL